MQDRSNELCAAARMARMTRTTRQIRSDDNDFDLITDENGKKKLKIEIWFGSRKTSTFVLPSVMSRFTRIPLYR
ncbi:hypothetical protein L195_g047701 [Trifolium pratense]|uniref:Uncharacterized protein n=1 Tax=Trifolium pratense TaxID=57577 RepID=A0A2K3MLE2_TRIPR|nr:hypothetical protein L195_g047701 [Trifolium pratense]